MKLTAAALAALALSLPALAQSAEQRAAALKEWRANCTTDDPDLRLIYVQDAIAAQDATIGRICTRAALDSENPEVRALGLRAALALNETITFRMEMPAAYLERVHAAGDDQDRIDKVKSDFRFELDTFTKYGGTYTIRSGKVSLGSGSSEWTPMSHNGQYYDGYKLDAQATTSGIRLAGQDRLNSAISLDLDLEQGGFLVGTMTINSRGPYPVVAELL